MTTTKFTIKEWIEEGIKKGATHVVVICDTWDYEDYPVYVMPGEDPRDHNSFENMKRPMECYDLRMNIEDQLNEHRALHWDM